MNVLIACEESQRVCLQFREKGHEAYSCDIVSCSGSHPEWHIVQNVLSLLNGNCEFTTMDGVTHRLNDKWDMIIAFPPCTKTSNAGARHLYKGGRLNISRYFEGLCGKALFLSIWASDCDKVIIENPTPSKIFNYPNPTQVIQPYEYGHPFTKKTLLWERGVDPLQPTNVVVPERTWCPSGSYSKRHAEKHKGVFTRERELKTEAKHSKVLQKQWRNSGGRLYFQ